jgi:hypothetical protein
MMAIPSTFRTLHLLLINLLVLRSFHQSFLSMAFQKPNLTCWKLQKYRNAGRSDTVQYHPSTAPRSGIRSALKYSSLVDDRTNSIASSVISRNVHHESEFDTLTAGLRSENNQDDTKIASKDKLNDFRNWMNRIILSQQQRAASYRLPPFLVEDWNVLLYDLFLIINLVVSISFWVVHRWEVSYIGLAFNEGCLLSVLWIVSGLFNGSFLYTAIDGHKGSNMNSGITKMKITTIDTSSKNDMNTTNLINNNNKLDDVNNLNDGMNGGPIAAGVLALNTYINTMNLRLLYALVVAVVEHRTALSNASELLIPLEFGYGIVLMILWRTLHSSYALR